MVAGVKIWPYGFSEGSKEIILPSLNHFKGRVGSISLIFFLVNIKIDLGISQLHVFLNCRQGSQIGFTH
jgi:hypothetical protein